ncbi:MAG TPA: hypothetical protein VI279_03820 [Rhodocyclaceae bacterium]
MLMQSVPSPKHANASGENRRPADVRALLRRGLALLCLCVPFASAGAQNLVLSGEVAPLRAEGRLKVNLLPPHLIAIELDGVAYRGEWKSVALPLGSAEGPTLDRSSRQYQRIASGLEPAPVVQVSTVLAANDAPPLRCDWTRRYGRISGACSLPDGRSWRLTAK